MNSNSASLPDDRDEEHLKLLSIFHYVIAGLLSLSGFFLIAHFLVMNTVFSNPEFWNAGSSPPPAEILMILRGIYVVVGFFLILEIVLNVLSARDLRTNQNRALSLIVSGINCLNMPLGTILGIFTIIVLMRPSVVERYQSQKSH